MRIHQRQAIYWLLLLLLSTTGCMGRGLNDGLGQAPPPAAGPSGESDNALFPGLPGLPSGELDSADGLARISVAVDNIQTGDMALRRSANGTEIQGSDLLLTGTGTDYSWGIWRWGTFASNDFPQQLILDYSNGAGIPGLYLALSNYTSGRWDIIGPLDGSVDTFGYPGQSTFLSENRNTYVALIQSYDGDSTVVSLNLRSAKDVNPPSPPTGLLAESVLPTRVQLQWDDNSEGDLEGYNLYLGTSADFELTDPATDRINFNPILLSEFLHDALTAETDYFYRLTAQDSHDNESAPTPVLAVTTPFDDLPGAPTDLQVLDVGSKSALVSWTEPADADLKGYRIYADTDMNFTVPPTMQNNVSIVPAGTNQYTIIGLDPSTDYFFRVSALDLGNQDGPLSELGSFTTLANAPPEPAFELTPDPAAVNSPAFFNPASTTDEDNDLSELTFQWDFDNSGGAPDLETSGAELAQWVYPARGVYTVKLTANDGVAETTIMQDILVSFNLQYQLHGAGIGDGATVQAVDGDSSGRLAVLYSQTGTYYVRYFDGANWSTLSLGGVLTAPVYDVALAPGKIGVVAAATQIVDPVPDPQTIWTVFEHSGANWVSAGTGAITNRQGNGAARLCYSQANGRLSVAMASYEPFTSPAPALWDIDVWHRRADNTLASYRANADAGNYNMDFDLVRNADTTRLVYSNSAGNLRLWTGGDASGSSAAIQTVSGTIVDVRCELDPDNDAQAYWYCSTATPRIYYGDNFGAANDAAQFFAPPRAPTAMLGLVFAGDNQGEFYWTDIDASGVQHYMYRRSSDNTTTDLASDVGLCNGGAGAPYRDSGSDRVFNALDEIRDGEIIGSHMDGDTELSSVTLYQPSVPSGATTTHVPVLMADGSVVALSQQIVPLAMLHHMPSIAQNSASTEHYGVDNYADLASACRTGVADEFFLASTTIQSRLLLYRFGLGDTSGTLELNIGPVQKVRLAHNADDNEVQVAYTTDNNRDIQVRSWDGAVWSGETTVFNGSVDIAQFELRPQANGNWGLAFFDTGSNLRLAETVVGIWQPAVSLGSDGLNPLGGLGFDYNTDGSYGLVVERTVSPGVYVGIDPLGQGAGAALAWEKVEDTAGSNAYSCKCFYQQASPVVAYHHSPGGISPLSRFRIYEKFGTWQRNELNYDIQGLPIGAVQNAGGDILLLGFSLVNVPYKVVSLALTN